MIGTSAPEATYSCVMQSGSQAIPLRSGSCDRTFSGGVPQRHSHCWSRDRWRKFCPSASGSEPQCHSCRGQGRHHLPIEANGFGPTHPVLRSRRIGSLRQQWRRLQHAALLCDGSYMVARDFPGGRNSDRCPRSVGVWLGLAVRFARCSRSRTAARPPITRSRM
jgi:hypothetical protein